MVVGSEWLLAGWAKIQSPDWGTSGKALRGFVAGALAQTSGPNPAVLGWYAWFLQHIVLPNAGLFSFLVTWGEFAMPGISGKDSMLTDALGITDLQGSGIDKIDAGAGSKSALQVGQERNQHAWNESDKASITD